MSIIENIGAGLMMTGLVLGAITGAIIMVLIPVGAGTLIIGAVSLYKHQQNHIKKSWRANYPPYGY